ncbi:hypothetical protein K440DRAFT_138823 [Wilcoxina mikolae CBS 423.85]|nr:hypothetical protein K440DRAFT_138823 [Wilcoxina mikolae CBS 423.85]
MYEKKKPNRQSIHSIHSGIVRTTHYNWHMHSLIMTCTLAAGSGTLEVVLCCVVWLV